MEYAVEVSNLCKKYENFYLDNVNIKIPKGTIMGFVGENGAGKTTTLKSILNLIHKDEGTIKILGLDHQKDEQKVKEQIGVVFDGSYFPETMNIQEVEHCMKNIYINWDARIFDNLINKFALNRKKRIKEYSRGMKMKLAIAVAMSHHAKLLILDEATSGLDPIVRDEVLDLLYDFIQDEENTILISSHITSDLDKIADYITFIHQGKIVLCESKEELLNNYGICHCTEKDYKEMDGSNVVGIKKSSYRFEVMIKNKQEFVKKHRDVIVAPVNIEDILLFVAKG